MAEEYFRKALDGLRQGQKFLTDRNEITVRYEIAAALEGQGKIEASLAEFRFVRDNSPSDSYYAMTTNYEDARLNLALWLANPTAENVSRLDYAASRFRFWLARDWNKLTTKLWGYYHGVCAYRQRLKYLAVSNQTLPNDEAALLAEFETNFRSIARTQKGVRRYELRFTSFFLSGRDYERFPGEPLRCDLEALLEEFKIH